MLNSSSSMTQDHDDIVVFRQFNSSIEANIAKTKLDAYGVPCFLTEENMSNLYPGQPFLAFKVRLHIFSRDEENAKNILEENHLSVDSDPILQCPKCHSNKIERVFPKRMGDSLKMIFFGVLFPNEKVNHCLGCDYEF
jgi:hypothetical protein